MRVTGPRVENRHLVGADFLRRFKPLMGSFKHFPCPKAVVTALLPRLFHMFLLCPILVSWYLQ